MNKLSDYTLIFIYGLGGSDLLTTFPFSCHEMYQLPSKISGDIQFDYFMFMTYDSPMAFKSLYTKDFKCLFRTDEYVFFVEQTRIVDIEEAPDYDLDVFYTQVTLSGQAIRYKKE